MTCPVVVRADFFVMNLHDQACFCCGQDLGPGVLLVTDLQPEGIGMFLDPGPERIFYRRMCSCPRTNSLIDAEHVVLDAQPLDYAALADEEALLEPGVSGI